jgi:hypothetical protein
MVDKLTDGYYQIKRDSLGRRRHPKQDNTRKPSEYNSSCNVRMSKFMRGELEARAKKQKTTATELVRTYIEWGLENDKID